MNIRTPVVLAANSVKRGFWISHLRLEPGRSKITFSINLESYYQGRLYLAVFFSAIQLDTIGCFTTGWFTTARFPVSPAMTCRVRSAVIRGSGKLQCEAFPT